MKLYHTNDKNTSDTDIFILIVVIFEMFKLINIKYNVSVDKRHRNLIVVFQ